MKFKKFRPLFILPASLAVLVMACIFYFSAQPGVSSAELSDGINQIIIEVFYPDEDVPESSWMLTEEFAQVIRKTGHFLVYMLLGLPVFFSAYLSIERRMHQLIMSFAVCTLYAISDEVHQLFVPDRYGLFTDVLIDATGALFGISLGILCVALHQKKQKKRGHS